MPKPTLLEWNSHEALPDTVTGMLGDWLVIRISSSEVLNTTLQCRVFGFLPGMEGRVLNVLPSVPQAQEYAERAVKFWVKKSNLKQAFNHGLI